MCLRPGRSFRSFIATRMRRWLGLSPSRTSGSARSMIVLIAYVRYESLSSRWMSCSTTRSAPLAPVPDSTPPPPPSTPSGDQRGANRGVLCRVSHVMNVQTPFVESRSLKTVSQKPNLKAACGKSAPPSPLRPATTAFAAPEALFATSGALRTPRLKNPSKSARLSGRRAAVTPSTIAPPRCCVQHPPRGPSLAGELGL
jgi:hypothetical protein